MFATNSLDEVSRILQLNKLAMDDNPTIACSARIAKDLFPMTEMVFEREFEKDPEKALEGYSNFVQSLIVNKVIANHYCGHPECSKKMLITIKELFMYHFDKTIDKLPEILNQITEET